MIFTFLGTGSSQQVPVFGCHCRACQQAHAETTRQRGPCSARIDVDGEITWLDAGYTDLTTRLSPTDRQRFLLTHYHMDHVQGLFPLRWGCAPTIPVYGPADEQGCDDLFRHPGMLAFQPPLAAFERYWFGELLVTPLPLIHSRLTLGYLLTHNGKNLAYLTDTVGLPAETGQFLQQQSLDVVVIDCSHPPTTPPSRNHNDLNQVIEIHQQLRPKRTLLTHLSHEVDCWLLDNSLPSAITAAYDGQQLVL